MSKATDGQEHVANDHQNKTTTTADHSNNVSKVKENDKKHSQVSEGVMIFYMDVDCLW